MSVYVGEIEGEDKSEILLPRAGVTIFQLCPAQRLRPRAECARYATAYSPPRQVRE